MQFCGISSDFLKRAIRAPPALLCDSLRHTWTKKAALYTFVFFSFGPNDMQNNPAHIIEMFVFNAVEACVPREALKYAGDHVPELIRDFVYMTAHGAEHPEKAWIQERMLSGHGLPSGSTTFCMHGYGASSVPAYASPAPNIGDGIWRRGAGQHGPDPPKSPEYLP
jgi:hypothetical protein